jgi:hypothetical protein
VTDDLIGDLVEVLISVCAAVRSAHNCAEKIWA